MTEKKKVEERMESGGAVTLEEINKKLNDLEAKVRKHTENWKRFVSRYVSSLSDGEVGSIRWALAFLLVIGVAVGVYAANQWSLERPENAALNTIEVDSSGDLTIVADDANDATLVLDADQGDDTADTWTVESEAADNDLSFVNGVTERMKLSAAGVLTVAGGVAAPISGAVSATTITASSTTDLNGAVTSTNITMDSGSTLAASILTVASATDATTKDTGSIITEGGIGIEKALFVGSATASSSKDTGAIICEGGIGTEEDVYAGGNIVAVGDVTGATVASITAANLVDKSATESISGVWTHSTNVIVSGTTVSSSKDTGCLVVEGGVGVEEDVYVGGQVVVVGAVTAAGLLDSDTTGVTGSFNVGTNLSVAGTLTVTNTTDLNAATTATNITMDAGSTLAAQILTVAGAADLNADSTATNITMDAGSTLAAQILSVAGAADLNADSTATNITMDAGSTLNIGVGSTLTIPEGALTDSTVVSDDIKADTIVNSDINSAAAIAHTKLATDGLGAVVAATGTQTETVSVPVITVITFTNVVVTATDGTAEGESVKVYDADVGQFTLLAAIANCNIVSSAGTTGDFAVAFGTVAADDFADLTATEVDVIPSTAISTTGGTVLTNAFDAVLAVPIGMDGTATAKDIYFNFGIADAAMDANNSTNTVTGTLTLITTKCVTNQ